jgi:hypothetical protein
VDECSDRAAGLAENMRLELVGMSIEAGDRDHVDARLHLAGYRPPDDRQRCGGAVPLGVGASVRQKKTPAGSPPTGVSLSMRWREV